MSKNILNNYNNNETKNKLFCFVCNINTFLANKNSHLQGSENKNKEKNRKYLDSNNIDNQK